MKLIINFNIVLTRGLCSDKCCGLFPFMGWKWKANCFAGTRNGYAMYLKMTQWHSLSRVISMTWFLEALKIKEEETDIEWSCDVRFIIHSYGNQTPTIDPEIKNNFHDVFFQKDPVVRKHGTYLEGNETENPREFFISFRHTICRGNFWRNCSR